MKATGYLLLCAGFLGGAYATALDIQHVNWTVFVVAAFAAVVGVAVLKRHASAIARSGSVLELNRSELKESIRSVVNDLQGLSGGAPMRGNQLRYWIDDNLRIDLRRFADARESMVHLFGLQTYADIMSNFAAGERYINRVWSASADGYDGEAAKYLEKATAQFANVQARLIQVTALAEV